MKIPNETKVGVLVVIAIVLLILGFNLLKGNQIFSNNTTLYAVYHDVDGLSAANPVKVNGLKIGAVSSLKVMDESAGAILVKITISSDVQVPSNSVAKIASTDLLGSKAVLLTFGNASTFLQDNDTIASAVSKSLTDKLAKKLDPISDKVQTTLTALDTVLTDIHSSLDAKTQKNLRTSIAALSETMQNFSATSSKLDKLVSNLNDFMKNINGQNQSINQILDNTRKATSSLADADLAGTVQELNTTLKNLNVVMDKVNNGKGSLGMLINNKQLYQNLKSSTYNLNLLMEDLRLNPKRYVHFSLFGKKSKPLPLPSDTLN